MAFYGHGQSYPSPYVNAPIHAPIPPPGPIPGEFDYDPEVQYAEPGSPMIFPVSPTAGMSPVHSRDNSRTRHEGPVIHVPDNYGRDRSYHSSHLNVGASSKALSRSNSERSRPTRPVYVEVAKNASSRGRHGRAESVGTNYYYDEAGRKRAGSAYSNSSYGSRGHSRSQSKARHSRSSSRGSFDSLDDRYHGEYEGAVAPYRGKGHSEEDLSLQLRKVQLQLDQVHAETNQRKKEEENAKLEKLRTEEIERLVSEKLQLQRRKEVEAAAAAKKKEDDEKARIKAEAEKLLAERLAAEKAKKDAEDADKARIQAIVDQERAKYEAMNRGRRTYTKFSKVHLCKEALDERKISYTEEVSPDDIISRTTTLLTLNY